LRHSLFLDPPATAASYRLSLHDALPILIGRMGSSIAAAASIRRRPRSGAERANLLYSNAANSRDGRQRDRQANVLGFRRGRVLRSEEHTSELQSLAYLVCRLLLEKKKHV